MYKDVLETKLGASLSLRSFHPTTRVMHGECECGYRHLYFICEEVECLPRNSCSQAPVHVEIVGVHCMHAAAEYKQVSNWEAG